MLEAIAWISIVTAIICALWIGVDTLRHSQPMAVMNVVWPVSALYLNALALWAYYRVGRPAATPAHQGPDHDRANPPTGWQVAVATSHCGAGCMLADVVCGFAIAAAGITLFGSSLLAEYAVDLVAAWALGIVFQYFAIQPMRHLPVGEALWIAIKADTLSIAAFQLGMYAWMAITLFLLFPHPHLTAFEPQYWLMMQIAMICGYAASFPVNRWVIHAGIKEAM